MKNLKVNLTKTINWFVKNRNTLFLAVCLVIHGLYLGVFYILNIWFLMLLNFISCSFYFYFLFIKRDTSQTSMAATYFEILLFSVLSELALGSDYGFFLYIVGMSAAVFYLLPSYGNKRFLYQIIGIATVFFLEAIVKITGIEFISIQEAADSYKIIFYLANLMITAVCVLGATFFYSKETEQVWDTLEYNMNHDILTGLYNRRFFEQQVNAIQKSEEFEESQYVISMVDIDYFKKVNDTYGHEAGDVVLAEVAACLKDAAGDENLAVRWGGEEFILYYPKAVPEEVYPVIEALRKKIEKTVIISGGKDIRITITAGIATGIAGSNYEKVIKGADEKLYIGKQRGRNQVIM